MKYTKEQLEAPLGKVVVLEIKKKDLGEYKRWRIIDSYRTEYSFSVEELIANECVGTINLGNLLSTAHKSEFFMDVCWHVSKEYSVIGILVPTKFNTQQEAKDYIDNEIVTLTPVTKCIVGTYPEEGD